MTDVREETRTTTNSGTEIAGDAPKVEVYDNNRPNTSSTTLNPGSRLDTPAYDADRRNLATAEPTTNWTAIVLVILVVLALVLLAMWLF